MVRTLKLEYPPQLSHNPPDSKLTPRDFIGHLTKLVFTVFTRI